MGRIQVDPAALGVLGGDLRRHGGEAQEAHGLAVGQANVSTGAAELDASLGGFARVWSRRLSEVGVSVQELADAVEIAALNYQATDRSAMPAQGSDGADGEAS